MPTIQNDLPVGECFARDAYVGASVRLAAMAFWVAVHCAWKKEELMKQVAGRHDGHATVKISYSILVGSFRRHGGPPKFPRILLGLLRDPGTSRKHS